MITHAEAERLREMLGNLQFSIIGAGDITNATRERLVNLIGEHGFRLVDELEGVVR